MSRSAARRWAAGAALVVVLAAAAVWWLDRRTRPDAVGPHFVEALIDRHPGTTVDGWSGGVLRIATPSGVSIEVRLAPLFDACRVDRLRCGSAIDATLADVDRADQATREPQRSMLRPRVVDGTTPGSAIGYVTEPFIGRYELRYALVDGSASTFVTSAIADRLGLSHAALKSAAIAALRSDPTADASPLTGHAAVFVVRGIDDPVTVLLDHERMRSLATRLGTPRLYAAVPARGMLYLAKADDAGAKALAAAMPAGGFDLLAYDVDATDGSAMTIAPRTP